MTGKISRKSPISFFNQSNEQFFRHASNKKLKPVSNTADFGGNLQNQKKAGNPGFKSIDKTTNFSTNAMGTIDIQTHGNHQERLNEQNQKRCESS